MVEIFLVTVASFCGSWDKHWQDQQVCYKCYFALTLISVKLNLSLTELFLDVVLYPFTLINCCHSLLLQLDSRSFGSASDYDHDTMIKKLSRQREENSQLVNQNHKLMTELENLSYDLHQARNKVFN